MKSLREGDDRLISRLLCLEEQRSASKRSFDQPERLIGCRMFHSVINTDTDPEGVSKPLTGSYLPGALVETSKHQQLFLAEDHPVTAAT